MDDAEEKAFLDDMYAHAEQPVVDLFEPYFVAGFVILIVIIAGVCVYMNSMNHATQSVDIIDGVKTYITSYVSTVIPTSQYTGGYSF